MTEPSTSSTGIQVVLVSQEGWGDPNAHIVLDEPSEHLKFEYAITGLADAALYQVILVFTPDIDKSYQRRYNKGRREFELKEIRSTRSGVNKEPHDFRHRDNLAKGAHWMKENVNFNPIIFKKYPQSRGPPIVLYPQKNELYLATGWKYQVAVRIEVHGMEGIVYEKDVPGQTFVTLGEESGKRKSGGDVEVEQKRQKLEEDPESCQASTSQAIPAPNLEPDQPSSSQQVPPDPAGQPVSSHQQDRQTTDFSGKHAFKPFKKP